MDVAIADIEANGFNPTVIHCVCLDWKDVEYSFTDMVQFRNFVKSNNIEYWVFHNGLSYDAKVINKLVEPNLIDYQKVIDTFVCSRLFDYTRFNTHSLKELGQALGVYKGEYTGTWDYLTSEMLDYCKQDVRVTKAIFKSFSSKIFSTEWKQSLRTEHNTEIMCAAMSDRGFMFNKSNAVTLLDNIKDDMKELEDQFQIDFPPTLQEVNRIQYRVKPNGEEYQTVINAKAKYPATYVVGSELVCMDYVEFNPGSAKQRIDKLWEAGWKPTEKTKGHKIATRSSFYTK